MHRFDMELGERIHRLNLLCGANLDDSSLRLAMREVDGDKPEEMYEQAKKALKNTLDILPLPLANPQIVLLVPTIPTVTNDILCFIFYKPLGS